MAQSGDSRRKQRMKSRGHCPGFWESPALGWQCQDSARAPHPPSLGKQDVGLSAGNWSRDGSPRVGDLSASWPGAAGPPHRDLHGTAQRGTVEHDMSWCGVVRPVCTLSSATRSVTGPVRVKPAPAGGQDVFLSILLPRASSLQAAHSSLLPSPPLPSPPPLGTLCSSWPCWETWDSPASGTGELQLAPVPGSCCQLGLRQEPPVPAAQSSVWAANRCCWSFTANSSCLVQTKRHRLWSQCGQSHAAAGHHRPRHCPPAGGWQQGSVPRMQQRPCCRWELGAEVAVGCKGCPRG